MGTIRIVFKNFGRNKMYVKTPTNNMVKISKYFVGKIEIC
jgi:hypothetical protein